jgi:hypothetical protein
MRPHHTHPNAALAAGPSLFLALARVDDASRHGERVRGSLTRNACAVKKNGPCCIRSIPPLTLSAINPVFIKRPA